MKYGVHYPGEMALEQESRTVVPEVKGLEAGCAAAGACQARSSAETPGVAGLAMGIPRQWS